MTNSLQVVKLAQLIGLATIVVVAFNRPTLCFAANTMANMYSRIADQDGIKLRMLTPNSITDRLPKPEVYKFSSINELRGRPSDRFAVGGDQWPVMAVLKFVSASSMSPTNSIEDRKRAVTNEQENHSYRWNNLRGMWGKRSAEPVVTEDLVNVME